MKLICCLPMGISGAGAGGSEAEALVVAATTSVEDSGILQVLNEGFLRASGRQVRVIAEGSGHALERARAGGADVVMAHSPEAESAFMAEGFGIERRTFMHNDFVLLGPPEDPAGAARLGVMDALRAIADNEAPFTSRADRSGTAALERKLWKQADREPSPRWRICTQEGMGAALRLAHERAAYIFSDRGTFLALRDQLRLNIISQDPHLLANPYSIILVNPERHPQVKRELGLQYLQWLLSPEAQRLIDGFTVHGRRLFTPVGG